MLTPSWPAVLGTLAQRQDLTPADARWAMNEIMSDAATSAQIAAFGIAVKIKGPAPENLTALAAEMSRTRSRCPSAVCSRHRRL